MNEFDPNFAPPGMVAKKVDYKNGVTCKQCFFYQKDKCKEIPCCPYERPDKATAIVIQNLEKEEK